MRKFLFPLLASLFLYSSVATACPYHYGYNNHPGYNEQYLKLIRKFEEKKYELNKLYDQGVSEKDEKARLLIKELDAVSAQMQKERNTTRPYSNHPYHHAEHCW